MVVNLAFGVMIFSVLVLIAVIVFQGWQLVDQRRHFTEREKDLLNRIMTTDYAMYVNGEVVKEQAKKPFAPAYEEEHGIPVI